MGGRGNSSGLSKITPLKKQSPLPELEGSEKQVSWARSIRKELLQNILNGFHYTEDGRQTDYMNHLFSESSIDKHIKTDHQKDVARYLGASWNRYLDLREEKSAKFWIDNRDSNIVYNGKLLPNYDNEMLWKRVFGMSKTEWRKRRDKWR